MSGSRWWAWRHALVFALFSGVIAAIGWRVGLGEFVGCGFAGITVAVVSILAGRKPSALRASRALLPDHVGVGEAAELVVSVTNGGRTTTRPLVGIDFDGRAKREFRLPSLQPGATHRQSIQLVGERRGVFETGPTRVEGADPFRLIRSVQDIGRPSSLVVHPRIHKIRPLCHVGVLGPEGRGSEATPNGSESFHALRDYVRGDDHRHIHWRSVARRGQLVVRQFVDIWVPEQVVVLDDRSGVHDAESFELALEIATSLLVAGSRQRWPVTLVRAGGAMTRCGPVDGTPGAVLGELARCQPDTNTVALERAATSVTRLSHARTVVLVTGATPGPELISFDTALRNLPRRIVIRIAKHGQELPPGSLAAIEHLEVADIGEFLDRWRRLR